MGHTLNVWVVGGDQRQRALAALLREDGHLVHTYALGEPEEDHLPPGLELAHCVVLPLPAEGEPGLLNTPLSEGVHATAALLDRLRPGQLVCAGRVTAALAAAAAERSLTLVDYFAREELAVSNAVPTAEGAIQIAMEEMPVTLHGARVLVLGWGRLGKLLAHRLDGLGARVTVAARRCADLAWVRALGHEAEHIEKLAGWLCGYDLVVNTVPHRILNETLLGELKPGALVIDLASRPGGVDLEGAARLGVQVVWALSLPGKVAPVTAGGYVRDTIYNIMEEAGVTEWKRFG